MKRDFSNIVHRSASPADTRAALSTIALALILASVFYLVVSLLPLRAGVRFPLTELIFQLSAISVGIGKVAWAWRVSGQF